MEEIRLIKLDLSYSFETVQNTKYWIYNIFYIFYLFFFKILFIFFNWKKDPHFKCGLRLSDPTVRLLVNSLFLEKMATQKVYKQIKEPWAFLRFLGTKLKAKLISRNRLNTGLDVVHMCLMPKTSILIIKPLSRSKYKNLSCKSINYYVSRCSAI